MYSSDRAKLKMLSALNSSCSACASQRYRRHTSTHFRGETCYAHRYNRAARHPVKSAGSWQPPTAPRRCLCVQSRLRHHRRNMHARDSNHKGLEPVSMPVLKRGSPFVNSSSCAMGQNRPVLRFKARTPPGSAAIMTRQYAHPSCGYRIKHRR